MSDDKSADVRRPSQQLSQRPLPDIFSGTRGLTRNIRRPTHPEMGTVDGMTLLFSMTTFSLFYMRYFIPLQVVFTHSTSRISGSFSESCAHLAPYTRPIPRNSVPGMPGCVISRGPPGALRLASEMQPHKSARMGRSVKTEKTKVGRFEAFLLRRFLLIRSQNVSMYCLNWG